MSEDQTTGKVHPNTENPLQKTQPFFDKEANLI